MSKRLQVVMPDDEYEALERSARRRRKPVAQVVRDALRRAMADEEGAEDPEQKLAAVLRFARYSGPTGDIEQLLGEIESGRGLS